MAKMIFISLPVADLKMSAAFYAAMGGTLNPQFSDPTGSCMVFSDAIYVMLLTHAKWSAFSQKPIMDARKASEVHLILSADTRDEVNSTIEAAGRAGGRIDVDAPQDESFMFSRSVEDPDGHIWEICWMDSGAMSAEA